MLLKRFLMYACSALLKVNTNPMYNHTDVSLGKQQSKKKCEFKKEK